MNLTIGASTIVEIDLVDVDGNTINRDDAESLSIQIRQYLREIATYVFGDDEELQDGTTASKVKIEITQELSAKFKEGRVIARAIIDNTDSDFEEDQEQRSLPDYDILYMYLELPDENDDEVTVVEHYRGIYDASVNTAPSSGGSGTSGAILAGDYWIIGTSGTIFGTLRPVDSTATAKFNSPGQTQTNWIFQGSSL